MNDTERAKIAELAGRVDDCLIYAQQLVAATAEPDDTPRPPPQLVRIVDELDRVKEELAKLVSGKA